MFVTVKKRDGRYVPYDRERIERAIGLAIAEFPELQEKGSEIALELTRKVEEALNGKESWEVEEIQDIVEQVLMSSGLDQVAKAYIIYRNKRDMARKSKSDQIISDIVAAKKNDITRENANMNADTPAGMMMKIASERSKEFVKSYLLSENAARLVEENILHIHDMDYYPTKSLTCIQHPIDKLLSNGFQAGHGESRSAKRIETASILSAISLETIQNEMHGGQAIPAFDFYMAPYVRKTYEEEIEKLEKLFGDLSELKKEPVKEYIKVPIPDQLQLDDTHLKQYAINNTVDRVHQSMEAFIHNMNTIHSRGGEIRANQIAPR